MYNLAEFSLQDMTACSTRLRRLGPGATSMEDVANRLVRYLYDHLIDDKTRQPACALARLFRTQTYGDLSNDSRACVRQVLEAEPASPELKCLTLAATAGERVEWNDIAHSHRYKAIPLVSAEFLAQFPMFSQLFIQLGVDLDTTLRAGSNLLLDAEEHAFNVFHVPHAMGSPFVPVQQDFVIPYGIRSVLGFGGLLPSGNLFAVILFSKVFLSGQTADLFKTLALSAQLALLPFDGTPTVQESVATTGNGHAPPDRYGAQVAALEQLLTVHEELVITYAAQRKRAEEALQDSEARLSAVVHATNDVALFIDDHGLIKSWNHSAGVQFGYSLQETYGKPCTMIIADGCEGAFNSAMQAVAAKPRWGMSGTTSELVGRKKDGTTFPLELSLTTCKGKANLIILATFRDITERKRVEAALEQSESYLRNLIGHAPDAIFTLSADGVITSLNPAFETMTHWSRNEWVGKRFDALVHPDDAVMAREIFNHILTQRCPITWVLRLRSLDRGVIIGEFVGTPLIEEGQAVGLLAIARDITERKAIENALRASEEQLRSIVHSTKDGIISLDRHGQVIFWNHGAEEIFGYPMEDMIGRPVTRVIPERFREAHQRGIMRAAAAGHLTVSGTMFELVGLRRDGTEFPLEFTLAAWKTQSGLFFTGIVRDITERKRAEDAMKALVRGTASVTGEEFFPVFVRQLAAAVGVQYAYVTEMVSDEPVKVRILTSWEDGKWGNPCELDTTNTPCGVVLRDRSAYYTDRAQELFPEAKPLKKYGVTSFLGVPLVTSSGKLIGHVFVMDAHPLKSEAQALDIINIFAARAAAELERLHATAALRQSEARQALILNSLPIAFYTVNVSADLVTTWVSENLERLTGFEPCKFLDAPGFWATRIHPEDRERVLLAVRRGRDVGAVSTEYRWQNADGSYRWYLDNAVYTPDTNGNPKELIGAWIDITRRKRAEEALQESERRFADFMDHIPAAVFIKDEEGRYVYVNRELEHALQVSAEELYGRTDEELWPHHIAEQLQRNDQRVFASNATLDIHEETVNRTGDHQYWRVIKFPIVDVAGKHYLGGIAVDVTGRRLAEEALRQAEEQYRSIFENAAEGIFQTTPEGRYLTVNPALARLYGYESPDEMVATVTDIGKHIYADPFRRAEFLRLIEEQGSLTGFESQIIRKDRQIIWISESVRVVRDAAGRIMHFEGMVEDITARKRAEHALRESEERLRLSLFATQVGIWDWNIMTGQLVWSDTVAPMFGLPVNASPPTYKGYVELIHPEDREVVRSAIARAVAGEAAYALEHRLVRPDGAVRWVACKGEVLRSPDGAAVRMLGTVQDVTDRKCSEAQLHSALTRLRTLSGRLEVIREEERGRIARELHDEFGVGLTCLKIDLSRLKALMGNTVGQEKRRPFEEKIHSMEEFIDATIGGVQRIVSELRPAILDDLGLVAAIEWQAQDFQHRTGIACTVDVNEDHFDIDSERATVVFRICQEALTNVARHAHARTVSIRSEAQQGMAMLEVSDDGRGIAEEKITDPRSLGLLGMRERAELFGGSVTIAGRPEAGTVVTLHVPCSRSSSVVEGS